MLDATAPPFDPVDLEPALRPFGQSRMLPGTPTYSPRVFAFEQERFFAGSWTCGPRGRPGGTGAQRAVRVGGAGVLLVRGTDGRVRAFANTCRHRGHELLGGRADHQADRALPLPRLDLRPGRVPAGRPGVPRPHRVPPGRARAGRAAAGELARVPVRQRLGRRPAVRRARRGPRRAGRPLPAGAARPLVSHAYDLACNWKVMLENYHECYHCPLIHPELCQVSPPPAATTSSSTAPGSAAPWT